MGLSLDDATDAQLLAAPLAGLDQAPNAVTFLELAAVAGGARGHDWADWVSPVLGALFESWPATLPAGQRDRVRPLAARVWGTAAQPEADRRRRRVLADWLVRAGAPGALAAAGRAAEAEQLAALPGFVDRPVDIAGLHALLRELLAATASSPPEAAGEPGGEEELPRTLWSVTRAVGAVSRGALWDPGRRAADCILAPASAAPEETPRRILKQTLACAGVACFLDALAAADVHFGGAWEHAFGAALDAYGDPDEADAAWERVRWAAAAGIMSRPGPGAWAAAAPLVAQQEPAFWASCQAALAGRLGAGAEGATAWLAHTVGELSIALYAAGGLASAAASTSVLVLRAAGGAPAAAEALRASLLDTLDAVISAAV